MEKTEAFEWGSKPWANDQLRFAIHVLMGDNIVSRLPGRIHLALYIRDRLLEFGWIFQARILETWIHRAQRGDFP